MHQRLHQTHDGERLGRLPAVTTGCDHLRASDTFKNCVGMTRTNSSYQSGAKHITGCLTSNQSNSHAGSLARQTALGRAQGFQEQVELGLGFCQLGDLFDRFGLLLATPEGNAISILDIANLVR